MSRRDRSRVVMLSVLAAGVVMGTVFAPSAAWAADQPTTIAFAASTQAVGYGSDWVASLAVTTPYESVDENDGTVDVYVDGDATAFAAGVGVHPGGQVFVTQPAVNPPLAAGTHSLLAIFRPAAGSGLATSQTTTPLALTVTPLQLTASARMGEEGRNPVVSVSLAGALVDSLGTPAGEWTVTVTGASSRTIVRRALRSAGDPASAEIRVGPLRPGSTATIDARFVASTGDASGPTAQPGPIRYSVPAETVAEVVSTPIPAPLWAIVSVAVLILGGAAVLAVQSVRLSRRPRITAAEPGEDAATSVSEVTADAVDHR